QERSDSVHAAELRAIQAEQRKQMEAINSLGGAMSLATGRSSADFDDLRRELLALREANRQNEQRLQNYIASVEARQDALELSSLPDSVAAGRAESPLQLLELGKTQ